MAEAGLKSRILTLLEEDREFRMSVAGLVGFKEVLERLEEHDRRFDEILATLREYSRRFEAHDRKFDVILATLREHSRRFEEHDRKFDVILATLREHSRRFEEHDRKFDEILATLREHSRRFEEHDRMFNALDLKIEALGARWGIFSEQAFRDGMKSIVEQYFGGEVERWITDDTEGIVFGRPSKVEVDLIVKGESHILVEIKSSIHRSDVYRLFRQGRLYKKVKGVKPELAIISPFVEADAKEEAEFYGIPLFTRTAV
jgi:hypothetical protein